MTVDIRVGDCLDVLRTLDAGSVQTCVTSPPYFGLRDYGAAGQIGLEATPDEYVAKLVAVFGEVRRVLSDDGTLWLNLGDSYANDSKWGGATGGKHAASLHGASGVGRQTRATGLPPKSLMLIPARVALALQADGWIVRSEIVWEKPNAMPDSVVDRPTRSHEAIFLAAKSSRYYYDSAAIAEPAVRQSSGNIERKFADGAEGKRPGDHRGSSVPWSGTTRNKRTVWTINAHPFRGAHFATFPPALIEPCILAGSRVGDTVLDPFGGAGTTGLVAAKHSRHARLIELNPAYAELARRRIFDAAPLFGESA